MNDTLVPIESRFYWQRDVDPAAPPPWSTSPGNLSNFNFTFILVNDENACASSGLVLLFGSVWNSENAMYLRKYHSFQAVGENRSKHSASAVKMASGRRAGIVRRGQSRLLAAKLQAGIAGRTIGTI